MSSPDLTRAPSIVPEGIVLSGRHIIYLIIDEFGSGTKGFVSATTLDGRRINIPIIQTY